VGRTADPRDDIGRPDAASPTTPGRPVQDYDDPALARE
jgi:hypothetical protein